MRSAVDQYNVHQCMLARIITGSELSIITTQQTTSTGFRRRNSRILTENRLDFDLNLTSESGRITSAHFDQFSTRFRLDFDVDFEETSAQKKFSTRFRRRNLVKNSLKIFYCDLGSTENLRRNQVKIWSTNFVSGFCIEN